MTEKDPNGFDPHQPGAKLDAGKIPLFRGLIDYFPLAVVAVAEVSAVGAKKYAWKGWETVPDGYMRYSDALLRHLSSGSMELTDKDTGLLHDAHAAWNALARLELRLRGNVAKTDSSTNQLVERTKKESNDCNECYFTGKCNCF